MDEVIITTPRLKLRHWKESDIQPFIKMNMDADVMKYFPALQTAGESLAQFERVKQHFAQYGYGPYALERIDNGQFIGYTGFMHPTFKSHFTPCIEIAWKLSKDNWHKGFATEAAIACIKYGFTKLNLDEILSFTAAINKPSMQVMERAGLKKIGEFEHPLVADGHILKTHVLYKIARQA